MRDDSSPCCLLALPLLAGNKVHQIYKQIPGINYRSLSLWDKYIHINKTAHKIFWEAGIDKIDLRSSPNHGETHWNCLMKPIASIYMWSWKSSKKLSSVMVFRKGQKRRQCFDPWVWFISQSRRCELDRVTIEMKSRNNSTHELLWVVTLTARYTTIFCNKFLNSEEQVKSS